MKKIKIFFIVLLIILISGCSRKNKNEENDIDKIEVPTPTEIIKEDVIIVEKIVNLDSDNFLIEEKSEEEFLEQDYDGDGILNKDEKTYNTDCYSIDTDGDGITDYDEIFITMTNPIEDSRDNFNEIIKDDNFVEGYVSDISGFDVYLKEKTDKLYILSKVSVDNFNNLNTLTEAYEVKNFNGKLRLSLNNVLNDIISNISIYKVKDNSYEECSFELIEKTIVFDVTEEDIICVVFKN